MTTQQHTIRDRTLRMAQKLGDRSGTAYEDDGHIKIDFHIQHLNVGIYSFSENNHLNVHIDDTRQGFQCVAFISNIQDDDLLESVLRQILAHHNVKL